MSATVFLKVAKVDAVVKVDAIITNGQQLLNSIRQEYSHHQQQGTWNNLPDEILQDWAQRFYDWQLSVHDALDEVYLAASSKKQKFDEFRSAMMTTGQKLNQKFTTITDKMRDKLEILQSYLEGIEMSGEKADQSITVKDSSQVVINTGTIAGDIKQVIGKIGDSEIKSALEELTQLVQSESSDEIDKESMLMQVNSLAKEAAKAPEERKSGIAKAAWEYIGNFAKVTAIANFIATHGDKITLFFGF